MSNDYLVLNLDSDDGLTVTKNTGSGDVFSLIFEPYNVFDENVKLQAKIIQSIDDDALDSHSLELTFIDDLTGDIVYQFKGALIANEDDYKSIVNVMLASEEFANVELIVESDTIDGDDLDAYNPVKTMNRKYEQFDLPAFSREIPDPYDVIVNQDYPANVMLFNFNGDNLADFITCQRAAEKLNIRLWCELPPDMTKDQALAVANSLNPEDSHTAFLLSPIVARKLGSTSLRGRKVPRRSGGQLLGKYVLRAANVNNNGVAPIHEPIAGYYHPFYFAGIEQAPNFVLDDTARKQLANAKINVIERFVSGAGVRYILGDIQTTHPEKSLLGLVNSSEVSMAIDNKVIEITQRHLLKPTLNTISDATRDIKRFLDSVTTDDRKWLTQSAEIGGGYYSLKIEPSASRPHDAIDIELAYHPQGATRAAYLKTTVTA